MRVTVEADGGSRGNPGPAGYGSVVLDAATGEVLAERAAGIGRATNNVAEYQGLIAGLAAAVAMGATEVEVRMDSKLVVEQMSGRWQIKHPDMKPLAAEAKALVAKLPRVRFTWIPRESNKHADRLANEAMDAAARGQVWRAGGDTGTRDAADDFLEKAAPAKLGWTDAPGVPTTLMLLRHGQTQLSVDKKFSGIGDPVLTDLGLAQAAAAADRLASSGATAVISSPLSRAHQTASAVAGLLGLDVEVDEGFRETDFGDWEGYSFGEIRTKWPQELNAWLADSAVAPPFGESFDATTTRVRAARDRLLAHHGGERVIVVSHVSPIKTLVRLALDAPHQAMYRMHLDLACLTEVQWFSDGPAVMRSFNDTHHLSHLAGQ